MTSAMRTQLGAWLTAALLGLGTLTVVPGCVVRVHGRAEVTSAEAPPPDVYEAEPGPNPGYVWVRGYHERRAGAWVWRPGHWERARADHAWVDGHWEHRGNRYHWVPGHFERSTMGGGPGVGGGGGN